MATTLINEAGLKLAEGDTARAVSLFARGNEIRESHLEAILAAGAEEQKRLFLATLSGETSAALHLNVAVAPSGTAATRLALTAVLQRKGRTLDAVASQTGALRRRLDPRAAELFDSLLRVRSQLAALALRGADGSDTTAYQAEVARLRGEEQRLAASVSELSAEYRTSAQPVTIEGVQRALPPGSALVEFASYRRVNVKPVTSAGRYGPERYAAYVLAGKGEPRVLNLGEADGVNATVGELRRALRDPRRSDVKQLARALDQKIMAPIRGLRGGARTLFISPDGALNLIPFGALVGENGRYLSESHTQSPT